VACIYSLSAAAAGKDGKLSPAERSQRPEQYAVRAVKYLQQAATAGYFKNAATIEHMEKDTDLDPLRTRPDYQNLLADLEKRASPGKP
jgi:hypothetical protein